MEIEQTRAKPREEGDACMAQENEPNVLSVAICDDDAGDAEALRELIRVCRPCETACYGSGEALLAALGATPARRFDVVFMDVYMGGMDGVETAQRLREAAPGTEIVFVTTSEDHALDAYGLNAAQYLVKPASRDAVLRAFRAALRNIGSRTGGVVRIREGRGERALQARDILYVESTERGARIHTAQGPVETSAPIGEIEGALPPERFLRCHQSYVVNFEHVRQIAGGDFIVSSGDRVYVNVKNARKIRSAYEDYLFRRARGG